MFGVGVGGLSNFSSEILTAEMAKQRVKQMKEHFAILEFHFYNAFQGYSTPPPVESTSWTRPAPLTVRVDTPIIRAYIEEIRTAPVGRAWLTVNAMACDPGQCSPTIGPSHTVENIPYLDVVAPNAARAALIAPLWATFAQALGYQGIFWSSMGQYGTCEGCDWAGFLTAAHPLLQEKGLEQNAEFIDGYGWDNSLTAGVNPFIAFPVWSMWGEEQEVNQYKATFFNLGSGCWSTSQMLENADQAVELIIERMLEANCHNSGYLGIVDGDRRIYTDYYPSAPKLAEAEVTRIATALQSPNPGCTDNRMYIEAHGLAHGVDLGLDVAEFTFNVDYHTINPTQFLEEFKQSLINAGTDPSVVEQMEIRIHPATPQPEAPQSRRLSTGSTGTIVTVTGYPEDVMTARDAVADDAIVISGHHSCELDSQAEGVQLCTSLTVQPATNTTTAAPTTTKAAPTTTTAAPTTTTAAPTTVTTTTAYNCSLNLSTCQEDWHEEKLEYCTAHNVSCTVTVNETNDTGDLDTFSAQFSCIGAATGYAPPDWSEERRSYCCRHEFVGCTDETAWWKEALLIFAVAAIAITVACVAAFMCRKKRMSFGEREPKIISQVPSTASGDEPVDEELQTPLVFASGLTPR